MNNQQDEAQAVEPKGVLIAMVARACTRCNAPGVWVHPKNDQERIHFSSWLACVLIDPNEIDEQGRRKLGQPVGDKCPCCGHKRPTLEDQGIIGRFDGPLFGLIPRFWQ